MVTEIAKLECVGHVQKRLGSRLRSLKKRLGTTRLPDRKGIGGKGRLTDTLIDKVQLYYGKQSDKTQYNKYNIVNKPAVMYCNICIVSSTSIISVSIILVL